MKYLLSSGNTTEKVEEYILDLFGIYFVVFPGDIPGNDNIGFDFNLSELPQYNILSDVRFRIEQLIKKIQTQFSSVQIELTDLILYNSETAKIIITVSGAESQSFLVNI